MGITDPASGAAEAHTGNSESKGIPEWTGNEPTKPVDWETTKGAMSNPAPKVGRRGTPGRSQAPGEARGRLETAAA